MRIASGMRATEGIGRRNSTVVWVARRRNGTRPIEGPERGGRGRWRCASPMRPRRHGAADVAPESQVARAAWPSCASVSVAVGRKLGIDDAERRNQLPGDEEADHAQRRRARPCAAMPRRGRDGAGARRADAEMSHRSWTSAGWRRRTAGGDASASRHPHPDATAAGSADRSPALRRARRNRRPGRRASSRLSTSRSDVNIGRVMPAAASSGISRFVAIAARTASSFAAAHSSASVIAAEYSATSSGSSSISFCVVMLVSTREAGNGGLVRVARRRAAGAGDHAT